MSTPLHRRSNLACCLGFAALIAFTASAARSSSFYTQALPDPKAVAVTSPSGGDDTAALQAAIDRVRETTGQGIVFVAPGRYQITNTIYIWPGIRMIGCGATRPVLVLPANTPGFQNPAREKLMIMFAGGGGRRRNNEDASGNIPDASPGTFYSALANIDIEIQNGNAGAVAIRSHYAQHCFLAHMDFHLGPAIAGIHEAGNVVEDLHFYEGRHAIWTGKPSPSWQFTVVDCTFENQRESAILEREAGLTLIRPHFLHVPTAVSIETNAIDELWVKDARLEDISGPAFTFGSEQNPCNEINMEGIACRNVPVFASLRDSGQNFKGPAGETYSVKTFAHGLELSDMGAEPVFTSTYSAVSTTTFPPPIASDLAPLPPQDTWFNIRDLGAKGDGITDDTAAFQKAIAEHRAIYLPQGFYIVRDTLTLRPDTVLIGLHPGATQIIVPDGTPAFQGAGEPKPLIEAPKGGSNILFGIGLYTSGNNPRAVAALWKAGVNSMLNDVRFLGGHGTPRPDGSRENPYNSDHSGDPNPNRHWDSQYPSLWVTDGGGGTFFDIWTPSTFARAGMLISDTETEGRVYQISSEHHVKHEIQIHNAAHWRIYALQTEEERGESGLALPLEVDSSHDITIANFHSYRVISSFQAFPWATKISNSRDIRFRNFHCYSNSKVSFDAGIYDQTREIEIRDHEFAWLTLSGQPPAVSKPRPSSVVEKGASVQKVAGGFYNISGGAVAPNGDIYFVDAHSNCVYRWDVSARQLSTITNASTLSPVNLMIDKSGNLVIVSYDGEGTVYALDAEGKVSRLKSSATSQPDPVYFLPVSDWISNRGELAHPTAWFISPDGTTALPVGAQFLEGAVSWGIKSSPAIRAFGLAQATPGKPFYVTEESGHLTFAADVGTNGSLQNFHLFANRGGENVASDTKGNLYIADGQIYVYDPKGKWIDTIRVPERPVQMIFGGPDRQTMFIAARSSLYSVRMQQPGW